MEVITPESTPETTPQKPDNGLVWSILSTIFCCQPFGIVAIIYSAQVDSLWNEGKYEASTRAAKQARTWTYVAFGTGLAALLIYLAVMAVAFFVAYFAES